MGRWLYIGYITPYSLYWEISRDLEGLGGLPSKSFWCTFRLAQAEIVKTARPAKNYTQ